MTVTAATSDTAHGNRGGGALHNVATPDFAGFMSAADKATFDDLFSIISFDSDIDFTIGTGATGMWLRLNGAAGQPKAYVYETAGSVRWVTAATSAAETGSNAGSNFVIERYDDTGAFIDAPFSVNRQTGVITMNAIASNQSIGTGSGIASFNINGGSSSSKVIRLRTNGVTRFTVLAGNTESGSNSGSNFYIERYDDAGTFLGDVVNIERSTGAINLGSGSGAATLRLNGGAGNTRGFSYRTNGSTRWFVICNSTAESGSNAGSNYAIQRYDDAGSAIDLPLLITRSTGLVTLAQGLAVTGTSLGIGYATGAGSSVTQLTSRTTGVTINRPCGSITLFSAAGSATATTFTVTNSTVAVGDTIALSVRSGTNVYLAFVTTVAAGSFNITFQTTGGVAVDSPVINFAVYKAVNA